MKTQSSLQARMSHRSTPLAALLSGCRTVATFALFLCTASPAARASMRAMRHSVSPPPDATGHVERLRALGGEAGARRQASSGAQGPAFASPILVGCCTVHLVLDLAEFLGIGDSMIVSIKMGCAWLC